MSLCSWCCMNKGLQILCRSPITFGSAIEQIIIQYEAMPGKILWTPQVDRLQAQEDQLILNAASQAQKSSNTNICPWVQASKQIRERFNLNKAPQQCRSRWISALSPEAQNNAQGEFSPKTISKIIALQQIHGNKWTLIASQCPGTSEIQIKNIFYSSLRRGIRTINSHIASNRNDPFYKTRRSFKENCVARVMAQDQGKNKRLRVTKNNTKNLARCTPNLYKAIKSLLLQIVTKEDNVALIKRATLELSQFNVCCRRVKGKRNAVRFNASDSELSLSSLSIDQKTVSQTRKVIPRQISSESDSKSESNEEEKVKQEESFRPYQQKSVFWLEDILQEEPIMEQTNKSDSKKGCRLEPTRDTEELQQRSSDTNKYVQFDRQDVILMDLELDIEGILSLPRLDTFLHGQEVEKTPEDHCFLFRDLQMIEQSNIGMDQSMEYPFNEYFA